MIKGFSGIKCIVEKCRSRLSEQMPGCLNWDSLYFSDIQHNSLTRNVTTIYTVHYTIYSIAYIVSSCLQNYNIVKSKTSPFQNGIASGPLVGQIDLFFLTNCLKRQNMRKQEKRGPDKTVMVKSLFSPFYFLLSTFYFLPSPSSL